ncbi:hypothetical protein BG011_009025 [Mortierella polycephala]|uniref:Uncharacterized protein n=1 Tax=Mortierella polycephala TaxID=41804 RepID=A0A9P6PLY4_9FUNG|nr:hypothetical protein BG011_009025 [Mortierella polycephala]
MHQSQQQQRQHHSQQQQQHYQQQEQFLQQRQQQAQFPQLSSHQYQQYQPQQFYRQPVLPPSTVTVSKPVNEETEPKSPELQPQSTQSSTSSLLSSNKRKAMSSAPTAPPKAKAAKPSQTVTSSSAPSRQAVASSASPSRSRNVQRTRGSNRTAHTFSAEEKNWIVTQLQDPEVFLTLQSERGSTVRLTPKAKIYDKIVLDFNTQFDYVLIDASQIKNKIAKMRTQIKLADAKRNESGFGSTDEEQWKKLITDICPFYFELEESWSTSRGNAPTHYADSLSNLGNQLIAEYDSEPSECIDVAEGDVEQRGAGEEEEEEPLIRRSRVQPPGNTTQHQHTSRSAAHRKRPRQLEQLDQQEQEQEQEERQEVLPSTSKKSKKTKEAVQKSVAENMKNLSEVPRLGLEFEQEIRQKELEARKVKDARDNAIAMKKLDMEEKRLDMEEKRLVIEQKRQEIEQKRLEMEMVESERSHTRKMAEIQADKDVALRKVEVNALTESTSSSTLEHKHRDLDQKIAQLETTNDTSKKPFKDITK